MTDDGGPVFPHHTAISNGEGGFHCLHEYGLCCEGMSLRTHAAVQAMHAHIITRHGDPYLRDELMREACADADFLIAELKKGETT